VAGPPVCQHDDLRFSSHFIEVDPTNRFAFVPCVAAVSPRRIFAHLRSAVCSHTRCLPASGESHKRQRDSLLQLRQCNWAAHEDTDCDPTTNWTDPNSAIRRPVGQSRHWIQRWQDRGPATLQSVRHSSRDWTTSLRISPISAGALHRKRTGKLNKCLPVSLRAT
jgi:hypothetical protein